MGLGQSESYYLKGLSPHLGTLSQQGVLLSCPLIIVLGFSYFYKFQKRPLGKSQKFLMGLRQSESYYFKEPHLGR